MERARLWLKTRWIEITNWLVIKLLVGIIRLTGRTCKTVWLNAEVWERLEAQGQPFILSVWHNNVYFSAWILRHRQVNPLISMSRDGEIITRIVEHFGFTASRGSSSKGGERGLLQMVRMLQKPVPGAITPDGPRGPKYQLKPGAIALAKLTGRPLVPWHFEALNQIVTQSWDGHKIPKPFTTLVTRLGEPIYVPRDLSQDQFEHYCRLVEGEMQKNIEAIEAEVARLQRTGKNL